MIIHRTYSEEDTEMINIFCTPHKYYPRLVWEGTRLYYKYPSIKNLIKYGGKLKVISKESNAHS